MSSATNHGEFMKYSKICPSCKLNKKYLTIDSILTKFISDQSKMSPKKFFVPQILSLINFSSVII